MKRKRSKLIITQEKQMGKTIIFMVTVLRHPLTVIYTAKIDEIEGRMTWET